MSGNVSIQGEHRASALSLVNQSAAGSGVAQQVHNDELRDNNVDVRSIKELKQAQQRGEEIPISKEQLLRAIEKATEAIQGPDRTLDFSIHEKTNKILVKVLNKNTGEVIREIPPEKTLDLLASLWEMAGILIDERR